jgi:hypothetical protein
LGAGLPFEPPLAESAGTLARQPGRPRFQMNFGADTGKINAKTA